MKTIAPNAKFVGFLTELFWQIFPPLAYLASMLRYFPGWNDFWIAYDEGYNLIKAMLVEHGFILYSEIWSDQPPLLTHLLAGQFRLMGYDIEVSRRIILLFSCIMVWAIVQYIRLIWGSLHAIFGAFFLIFVPNFIVLSVAVLVGQPSLTFAVLSMLALAEWHLRRLNIFIILSAGALCLSLFFKLFTAFLIPVFMLGLVVLEISLSEHKLKLNKALQPALIWAVSFTIILLGLGIFFIGLDHIPQLIEPHWDAARAPAQIWGLAPTSISQLILPAWPIILVALVGAVFAWRKRLWLAYYPFSWMIVAYLLLLNHQPVWWHHSVLVTIPAAVLACGAVGETLHKFSKAIRSPNKIGNDLPLHIVCLVGLVLILLVRVPDVIAYIQGAEETNITERNPAEDKFMRRINRYASQTNWMVTDIPMFAFRSGLLVPPNLAVISQKRFVASDLSETEIIQTMQDLQPEQVLLERFVIPELERYLSENYRKVLDIGQRRLFIRKDLQP